MILLNDCLDIVDCVADLVCEVFDRGYRGFLALFLLSFQHDLLRGFIVASVALDLDIVLQHYREKVF